MSHSLSNVLAAVVLPTDPDGPPIVNHCREGRDEETDTVRWSTVVKRIPLGPDICYTT